MKLVFKILSYCVCSKNDFSTLILFLHITKDVQVDAKEELRSFEREQKSAGILFFLPSQNNCLCIFAFNSSGLSEM